MKPHLLFRDRDFEATTKVVGNAEALTQDLELDTLFAAMAGEDAFVLDVVRKVMLNPLTDVAAIRYRQDVLGDCLAHAALFREILELAKDTLTIERRTSWGFLHYPDSVLRRSLEALELFVKALRQLRRTADEYGPAMRSEGLRTFFAELQRELTDDYFAEIQAHARELEFRDGVFISAHPGRAGTGEDLVLRKMPLDTRGWLRRLFGPKPESYSYHVPDRDESGFRALSELRDRGLNLVANALAQSNDHMLSYFQLLRAELAFYLGCVRLKEELDGIGEPQTMPEPSASGSAVHHGSGLYDICLALKKQTQVVGNMVSLDGKDLVVITGANQGGKSTFLRAMGLCQLMMQCGMLVPAERMSVSIATGIFTHYKREEDTTMRSGKLDEELDRMSTIVDRLSPGALVLFNESFAATNEREGSEIATGIVDALRAVGIKVVFVTHLFTLAHGLWERHASDAMFLRAQRRPDGTRTYILEEGEPLQTSFGRDLYERIFTHRPPDHTAGVVPSSPLP